MLVVAKGGNGKEMIVLDDHPQRPLNRGKNNHQSTIMIGGTIDKLET